MAGAKLTLSPDSIMLNIVKALTINKLNKILDKIILKARG